MKKGTGVKEGYTVLTCSMQGLKAQKTPSGRRHWLADCTT